MIVQEISICFSTPIRATGTAPLECRAVGMRGRTTDSTGPGQRSLRMERLCTTRCVERLTFCFVFVLAVADNPCVRNDCALPGTFVVALLSQLTIVHYQAGTLVFVLLSQLTIVHTRCGERWPFRFVYTLAVALLSPSFVFVLLSPF